MRAVWRLLVQEGADGYTNMAIDEALMRAVADGFGRPTLRFFRWKPACVSLGYFQSAAEEVDLDACRQLGMGCVRRPTGGRAILHDAELTYSVVASVADAVVSGSILESYRKISRALVAGLSQLGVQAEMKPLQAATSSPEDQNISGGVVSPQPRRGVSAACFDTPSDYEIAVEGRKLVGSAQTRQAGALLQHGSVLLDFDALKTFTVLRPPPTVDRVKAACWLAARVISLGEATGRTVSFDEVAEALRDGFSKTYELDFEPAELSPTEWQLVEELRAEKYGTEEWNLKR